MWRVLGRTVRGASHRRRQLPNQDALAYSPGSIAVADGHGSSACCRSGTGSAFAVKIALEVVGTLAPDLDFSRRFLDDVESALKDRLVSTWRDTVSAHLAANPFSPGELSLLGSRGPFVAYGSTLMAAFATDSQILLLQIGDGDILIVYSRDHVVRPWPRDPRLLGVETTSLCTEDAVSNIHLRVEPLVHEGELVSPPLVLLSTDGYSNSFRGDSDFLKVGGDVLEMIEQDGFESVERDLEGWLDEASRLGSGDDVTLGLLYRERHVA
jgi:serine/threonine protein phosphatase PrpC